MDSMIFAVLMLGGGLAFWYYMLSMQKEAWEEAGRSLGLELSGNGIIGSFRLDGQLKDRMVSVRQISKGRSGRRRRNRKRYFTEVRVGLKDSAWRSVKLKAKGLGGKVVTFFGGQDLETGDAGFDKDYRIQGNMSSRFQEGVRRGEVKDALGMIRGRTQHFEVEHGTLLLRHRGRCKRSAELESLITEGVEWSEGLDRAMDGEAARMDGGSALEESRQVGGGFSAPGAESVEPAGGGYGGEEQGDHWGSEAGGGGISAPGAESVESSGRQGDGGW